MVEQIHWALDHYGGLVDQRTAQPITQIPPVPPLRDEFIMAKKRKERSGRRLRHLKYPPDWWTKFHDKASTREGWGMFDANGIYTIMRLDDEALLPDDNAAINLCTSNALQGSRLHILALYLEGRSVDDLVDCPSNIRSV